MIDKKTLVLGKERERLAKQHDTVVDALDDADDSASASAVRYSENQIAQMGAAVAYLIEGDDSPESDFEGYGSDASVTIKGLSSGEYALVGDRVDSRQQQRDDISSTNHLHRNLYAAAGLVEAPFFDKSEAADAVTDDNRGWGELTLSEQLDARVAIVEDLPVGVTKWIHSRVDELTSVGVGNWKQSSEQHKESADN